jgi:hypothetical protein
MANNPVLDHLVNAKLDEKLNALGQRDTEISKKVYAVLGEVGPATRDVPAHFSQWCKARGLISMPARPATVAAYVLEHAHLAAIDGMASAMEAISDAHVCRGLSDPTTTWPVPAAMTKVAKNEPPKSWPKDTWKAFKSLPHALQVYVQKREADRDTALRRAQNDLAEQKKQLKKTEQANADENKTAA